MADAWFTEVADELARCLVDARHCAEAGEQLLQSAQLGAQRKTLLDALVAPIAVSRVLIELIDYPPQLALAAVRLLADTADAGAATLEPLDGIDAAAAIAALRHVASSARALIDATG
jgi:hypothetical protein